MFAWKFQYLCYSVPGVYLLSPPVSVVIFLALYTPSNFRYCSERFVYYVMRLRVSHKSYKPIPQGCLRIWVWEKWEKKGKQWRGPHCLQGLGVPITRTGFLNKTGGLSGLLLKLSLSLSSCPLLRFRIRSCDTRGKTWQTNHHFGGLWLLVFLSDPPTVSFCSESSIHSSVGTFPGSIALLVGETV